MSLFVSEQRATTAPSRAQAKTTRRLVIGGSAFLVLLVGGLTVAIGVARTGPRSPAAVEPLPYDRTPTPGGPLAIRQEDAVAIAVPTDVGQSVSASVIPITNQAGTAATIERVALMSRDRFVRLRQAFAVPSRYAWLGAVAGPPTELLRTPQSAPSRTRVVPRRTREMLILEMAVDRVGVHSFRGVQIDYRIGSARYRIVFPFAATLCAPAAKYPKECPTPRLGTRSRIRA